MRIETAFVVKISEPLDRKTLDRLRIALDLEKDGRLGDDWDYKFGHRQLRGGGDWATRMTLWRADNAPWYLKVTYPASRPPQSEELEQWRREIVAGIEKAGLTPIPQP
jgi:hypothetical protein